MNAPAANSTSKVHVIKRLPKAPAVQEETPLEQVIRMASIGSHASRANVIRLNCLSPAKMGIITATALNQLMMKLKTDGPTYHVERLAVIRDLFSKAPEKTLAHFDPPIAI